MNADPPERSYWRTVIDAASVSQQLCVVAACAAVPLHLRAGTLTAHTLLIIDAALLCLGGYYTCAAQSLLRLTLDMPDVDIYTST